MEIIKGVRHEPDNHITSEKEKLEVKKRLADQLIRVHRLDTTIGVVKHKYPQKGTR